MDWKLILDLSSKTERKVKRSLSITIAGGKSIDQIDRFMKKSIDWLDRSINKSIDRSTDLFMYLSSQSFDRFVNLSIYRLSINNKCILSHDLALGRADDLFYN